jgi:hypothetical protein
MRLLLLAAVLLVSPAVLSEPYPVQLIDRPLTLPRGAIEGDALINYTSYSENGGSATGESGVLGVEYGLKKDLQLGLAFALPLNPGFDFGSIVGSVTSASGPIGFHAQLGYERLAIAADFTSVGGTATSDHAGFLFASLGAPLKMRLSPRVALVSGTTRAYQFAFPTNFGAGGASFYSGGSPDCFECGDLVTAGRFINESDAGWFINLNLPVGILFQVIEPLSVTVFSGYHALLTTSGSLEAAHFVPLGVEAVLSPGPGGEFGVSVMLPGEVAQSSGNSLGYTDIVNVSVWLRLRTM